MTVASLASENGMHDLSRQAVRDAMIGGMPVSDPDPLAKNMNNPGMVVFSSTPQANEDPTTKIESQVAQTLHKVVKNWKGEQYPAEDVYELLRPLVLPTNRPSEIMMYADSSSLHNAVVSSLGSLLVDWAKKAGSMEDLKAQVEARQKNPSSQVAGSTLLTLIAIATEKMDDAKASLDQLLQQSQKGNSKVLLQLACHAAIPATNFESLRPVAFAICRKFLEQQTQVTTVESETEPSMPDKLADKVTRYLASTGDTESVKNYFESLMSARQLSYSRYGGSYGIYRQMQDAASFAGDAARIGMPSLALDFLGRALDMETREYSKPSSRLPLTIIFQHLMTKSPQERYQAWHDWDDATRWATVGTRGNGMGIL